MNRSKIKEIRIDIDGFVKYNKKISVVSYRKYTNAIIKNMIREGRSGKDVVDFAKLAKKNIRSLKSKKLSKKARANIAASFNYGTNKVVNGKYVLSFKAHRYNKEQKLIGGSVDKQELNYLKKNKLIGKRDIGLIKYRNENVGVLLDKAQRERDLLEKHYGDIIAAMGGYERALALYPDSLQRLLDNIEE